MADLKAAAERLRIESLSAARAMEVLARTGEQAGACKQERDDFFLAAQALEAWAWAAAQSMPIEIALKRWRILGRDQRGHLRYYYADTPLGAVLAAMEGERDA